MAEELKQKAVEYTDSVEEKKHWSDENESNAVFTREEVEQAYIDGATENGIQWHDLRKDPNDLPKVVKEYITNIGVMTFDRLKDRHLWTTPICDACDYYEEVTDEVIAWCEIPQFKE